MSSTLILITEHELHRFDLKGGRSSRVANHWEVPRLDTDDVAVSVDKILRHGPKRSTSVYVLNTDWWLGKCTLGQDVLRQTDQEGLRQSLAIEAESVSGLDAFDSQIAFRIANRSVSGVDYVVLQIPAMDLLAVDDVVRQWGGKLKGLAHPSLCTVASRSAGQQMRLEAWPNVSAIVQSATSGEVQKEILSGDLHMGSIQAEVRLHIESRLEQIQSTTDSNGRGTGGDNAWLEVVPGEATRWFAEIGLDQVDGVQVISVEEWARRWGEAVTGQSRAAIPFVVPGRRPVSSQSKVAMAALVGLLAILGCFAHWFVSNETLKTRETTIGELESDIKRLGELKKQVSQIEEEALASQEELDSLNRDQAWAAMTRDAHLFRHAALLEALSELTPSDDAIESIEGETDRLVVTGYTLDSQNCDRLTLELAERIRPYGWRVHPCKVTLNELQIYEFEIELTDDVESMDLDFARAVIASEDGDGSRREGVSGNSVANSGSPSHREGSQQ